MQLIFDIIMSLIECGIACLQISTLFISERRCPSKRSRVVRVRSRLYGKLSFILLWKYYAYFPF